MLSDQVFGAGDVIAIPLQIIGSMGGEYGPLRRRHSGKGRAVPGRCPSILVVLGFAAINPFCGADRPRHRGVGKGTIACSAQPVATVTRHSTASFLWSMRSSGTGATQRKCGRSTSAAGFVSSSSAATYVFLSSARSNG